MNVNKSDNDWKNELTPEQYHVLREKGTERAFTGVYHNCHDSGMYKCAACGANLFSSDAKFDSGTGWPSFDSPTGNDAIELKPDDAYGMHRTEVVCRNCGGHLGHLFDDGPTKTGVRYCINSAALKLDKKE